MEVFQTNNFYIFVRNEKCLWWNRTTSEFSIKAGWDLSSVGDIECLGITPGILGVISLPGVFDPHLLVVKEATPIGIIYPPHLVHKVKNICMLSNDEPDSILVPCSKHSSNQSKLQNSVTKSRLFDGSQFVNKTWGAVKIAGSTIKNTTQQAAALASNQMRAAKNTAKDQKKLEKQLSDEIHKIFDDSDSFYYCLQSDFTNNLQRRNDSENDDRFFWNKHMLKDILDLNDNSWILPVIQGFVQLEQCVIGNDCFNLALVSRRSRFRAGTRYKRRGIDENGHVANYVETEQILSFGEHQMAFSQVRGSVPVYWSQPGYKYRPPPKIDRDENETQIAFEKHFDSELKLYKSICIINLVEQSGKEKVVFDAFGNHVVKYNNDKLIYVTFDFHEYCRGMRFENVSALIEALAPEAVKMGFHWRDTRGVICNQNGVFRVNCMDCLDRTNVVQTAIGRALLESQLVKVGLMPPYTQVPNQLKTPFMLLWANNGDIISKQYAGTNALKGDYTRTGERNLAGLVKDGMNSANRYLIQHFHDTLRQSVIDLLHGNIAHPHEIQIDDALKIIASMTSIEVSEYFNYGALSTELQLAESIVKVTSYYLARFKDTFRQDTIDLMQGNPVSTESMIAFNSNAAIDDTDAVESAEHARQLVEDCRRMLLGLSELPMGSWGLINADPITGDVTETEVDAILLLTNNCYLVAEYDSNLDKIVRFEKVPLQNITSIELGMFQQSKIFQITLTPHLCLRINYTVDGVDGFYHMLRSAAFRFFNNVAVVIKTQEEIMESLTSILDFFRIALENCGKDDVKFITGATLQRRKSRVQALDIPKGMQRNLSESQLVQAGSRAVSNVAGQFTKLSQSLHPKIITGKKSTGSNKNNKQSTSVIPTEQNVEEKENPDDYLSLRRGSETVEATSIGDLEAGSDIGGENAICNENSFLPSVGIVMANSDTVNTVNQTESAKHNYKGLENVSRMSISSVTDNVVMPLEMLHPHDESFEKIEVAAPAINVQDSDDVEKIRKISGLKSCHSATDMRYDSSFAGDNDGSSLSANRNLPLHLPSSHSENALKQLKTLTSPLTKFAANIGSSLQARKHGSKTSIADSPVDDEKVELERNKLQEKWETAKCKTKLIAL